MRPVLRQAQQPGTASATAAAVLPSQGGQTLSPHVAAGPSRYPELELAPAWFRAVESAFLISDKRRGLLLPGSPDSTLLYAADRAEQEQHWCWWRRDVWLADTAFDEQAGRAVYESDKNCRIRRGSSKMAPTMSRLAALDALATECQARVLQHGAQATVKRALDACSATSTPKKQRDTASAPARSGARRGTSLTARPHSAATPPSKAAPSLSPDGGQCGPSTAKKRGQVRPKQTKVAAHQANMDIDLLAAGTAEAESDDKADAMMQHGAGQTRVAKEYGQRLALKGVSEAGHMKGPEVKAFRTRACARTRVRSSGDTLVAADVFDVRGIDDDTAKQGICGVGEKDPFAVSPSTQRIRSSKVCPRQRVLESKGATMQETTHDMGDSRGRRRYSREKACIESRDVTGMKAEEVNGQSETGRKRRVGRVAMQTNEEATMDGPRPKRGRTHALADEEQSEEKEPVGEEGMAPEADSVETRQQQASPSRLSRRDSLLKHAGKTRAHKAPTSTAATANAAIRWPEPKRHASSKAPVKPSEEADAGCRSSVRATKPRMQPITGRNLTAAAAASSTDTVAPVGSDVIDLARQLAAGIVPRDSHPADTQALRARTTSPSLPSPPAYATTPSTNSAGVAAPDAAVGQVKDPGGGKLVAEPEGQRAADAASASAALARRAAMRAPIVTAYYARAWQTRGTLAHVSHLDPAARQILEDQLERLVNKTKRLDARGPQHASARAHVAGLRGFVGADDDDEDEDDEAGGMGREERERLEREMHAREHLCALQCVDCNAAFSAEALVAAADSKQEATASEPVSTSGAKNAASDGHDGKVEKFGGIKLCSAKVRVAACFTGRAVRGPLCAACSSKCVVCKARVCNKCLDPSQDTPLCKACSASGLF